MISEFFFQVAGLKKLPRSGWKIKLGLQIDQSVCVEFQNNVKSKNFVFSEGIFKDTSFF